MDHSRIIWPQYIVKLSNNMTHKRYNLVDNGYLQLANVALPGSTTINFYFPSDYNWNKPLPTENWIGTLVKYGDDGNPIKMEKIYVTATSGTTLTVTRGYLGDGVQTFDTNDYLFLNIVAENLDDIHMRIDEVEEELQDQVNDLFLKWDHRLRVYRLDGDTAFQARVGAGTYRVSWVEGLYLGGIISVAPSVTTYIMIDATGTIQTSTSGWNSEYTRLSSVVSGSSGILSIVQWKNDAVGGVLWGLSFDDTRGTGTTPNDYNDSRVKAQLKNISEIWLSGIATGTYARLIGFRWQTSSSFWQAWESAYCENWIFTRSWSTTTWGGWIKLWMRWDDFFGSGADWDVVIATNTTLTRDMDYNNLTVNAWVTLKSDWYTIYCKNKLENNGVISDVWFHASGNTAGESGHFKQWGLTAWTITSDYLAKWWKWGSRGTYWIQNQKDHIYSGYKFAMHWPYEVGRILANRFIWSWGVDWDNDGITGGRGGGGGGLVLVYAMTISGSGLFSAIWGNWSESPSLIWNQTSGGGGGGSGGLIYIICNNNLFSWSSNVNWWNPWASHGTLPATSWEVWISRIIIL